MMLLRVAGIKRTTIIRLNLLCFCLCQLCGLVSAILLQTHLSCVIKSRHAGPEMGRHLLLCVLRRKSMVDVVPLLLRWWRLFIPPYLDKVKKKLTWINPLFFLYKLESYRYRTVDNRYSVCFFGKTDVTQNR